MSNEYLNPGPNRHEVDAAVGPVVLEFGTDWCGYCCASAPAVSAALADFPEVKHVRVEDGKGRRLGRSFGVKLWPTLIFLKDGKEVARAVRPGDASEIKTGLQKLF